MGASASTKAPPLEAMDRDIEMERMMGRWYVLASCPTPFEKNAFNATETYEFVDSGDTSDKHYESKGDADEGDAPPKGENRNKPGVKFKVTFGFNKGAFDGPWKEMEQKGTVYSSNCAEWRVQPKLLGVYLPVKLPFLIIDVADDYSWVTVGYPSRKYLWIMARDPQVAPELYNKIQARAVELGYDESKILKVPQQSKSERESM
eukprot:INCI9749.2.p1 GENE.INCI9749.2~~INCI9749.2.p1  ORF type:complete len:235 (-),score=37.66 INCI9749.2:140-751(-)